MSSTMRPLLAAAVWLGASISTTAPAAAEGWPARVSATFQVEFGGVDVGTFDFKSSTTGGSYVVTGNGNLSLLFGALKWTGVGEASGKLGTEGIHPLSFASSYKSTAKAGGTRMTYTGDTISSVLHDPPKGPKEGTVPVLPQHLMNVLDPMSAVLAMSKGSSGNPCSRRIPVYDGRARFDLILQPRGTVQLSEIKPSGQPGTGYVCRIKYVPIAGHKADDETRAMAQSTEIEIILRPIPSANVFVPYKVTIPTIAGSAVLKAKRVDITTSAQQVIALSH